MYYMVASAINELEELAIDVSVTEFAVDEQRFTRDNHFNGA